MARWRPAAIQLLWVIPVHVLKNTAKLLLGNRNYLRIFGADRLPVETPEIPWVESPVMEVINNEVVGKTLRRGTGPVFVDPSLCLHPTRLMKKRANQRSRWWTCRACQSRWERRALGSIVPEPPPEGSEILTVGRYVGKDFETIYNTDPDYCRWMVQTSDQNPQRAPTLCRLTMYAMERESTHSHLTT